MPLTNENVNIEDWNKAMKLVCPHIRYICGVWLAINENPCGKYKICNPCSQYSREKIILIKQRGD